MSASNSVPAAAIFGCSGLTLTDAEKRFFEAVRPLGFILFARNIQTPQQVRQLTRQLQECVQHQDVPILIDQEGGRVQRLRPPHWRSAPPGKVFADLAARDPQKAVKAARLNFQMIGRDLADLGINVDCAPVLDVPVPGSHDVIGDRAYGHCPQQVALLGRAVMDGLLDQSVLPVVKHMPGHGRAMVDSHFDLPVVEAESSELQALDFQPFRSLADAPWGMTAHVVYKALDSRAPATTSPLVISQIIRGWIGFDGVLVSDDLSMKALGGSFQDRTTASLSAGCDVVLHCNGDMTEMQAVADAVLPLTDRAMQRLHRANAQKRCAVALDMAQAEQDLAACLI